MALNRKSRCCVVIVFLLASFQSVADTAIDARHFEDPVMAERYRDLTASLRCPKCDAQAIDSSDSPVAADMRERVAMMLRDGRADKEILDFMANRFGEFVLYNPRLDGRTWLLWALPAALVAGGRHDCDCVCPGTQTPASAAALRGGTYPPVLPDSSSP